MSPARRRGLWPVLLAGVLLAEVWLGTPSLARADAGELAVGAIAGGVWPAAGELGLGLRLGLADAWAGDLRLSGGANGDGFVGRGSLGLVLAADFLAWVPVLRLAAGARLAESFAAEVGLTGGVRYYFARRWSVALEAGGRWSPGEWSAVANLVMWRDLD